MAKSTRASLLARALALAFALALAALAARLWLGGAAREAGGARAERDAPAEGGVASEPPLHEPHSAEDQAALRELLREAEREEPAP